MKWLKTGAAAAMVLLLLVAHQRYNSSRLTGKINELEAEKSRLSDYIRRLSTTRRVAQVNVLDQHFDDMNRLVTRLLWQEIGADGLLSKPIEIETLGKLVYFEALVVKFEHQYVEHGDPQRGMSLALFRRVFGERQAPDDVPLLTRFGPPSSTPADLRVLDENLWRRFWEMMDDPRQAAQFGVRVAQCEAPAVPLAAGQVWEVTLDSAGGLNLKRRETGAVIPARDDAVASK